MQGSFRNKKGKAGEDGDGDGMNREDFRGFSKSVSRPNI